VLGLSRQPEAFGVFYDRYHDAVLAYFIRRVRDPEVAADLMAETFAKALLALHGGAEVASPAAWLFSIAHSALVDSVRRGQVETRARVRLALEPMVLEDQDLERVAGLQTDAGFLRALEALPADQREAVRARVLDERDYGEIATALGCSQAVVRKRVSRGLERLRGSMEAAG
jgi:RNA polymerase sigma-70 factor (ECF subfamily)